MAAQLNIVAAQEPLDATVSVTNSQTSKQSKSSISPCNFAAERAANLTKPKGAAECSPPNSISISGGPGAAANLKSGSELTHQLTEASDKVSKDGASVLAAVTSLKALQKSSNSFCTGVSTFSGD